HNESGDRYADQGQQQDARHAVALGVQRPALLVEETGEIVRQALAAHSLRHLQADATAVDLDLDLVLAVVFGRRPDRDEQQQAAPLAQLEPVAVGHRVEATLQLPAAVVEDVDGEAEA